MAIVTHDRPEQGLKIRLMLLKIRSTMELLKFCPGILSRVSPRTINSDFRYATALRLVRDAPRENRPHLTACIMLHELHAQGLLNNTTLSEAGRQALSEAQDYYRKLHEERHQRVLDEVRERSSLSVHGYNIHKVRVHHGARQ